MVTRLNNKNVPFFANKKDDLHCYQAALRMVLKHFFPKRTYSWKTLEHMTGFARGKWTWPMRGALSLMDEGLSIRDIEQFDYSLVATDAKTYLHTVYGQKVGDEQIAHSDISSVEETAKEYIQRVNTEFRIPNAQDIKKLLEDGYLVTCLVNSQVLKRRIGYSGHCVVLFRASPSSVWMHDPGLPPKPNHCVSWTLFNQAWGYPDEKAKNILAFKL